MAAAPAMAAPRQNILEAVEAALAKDAGLTDEGRAAIVAAIRDRFHDYANRVVKPDGADLAVVLRMIAEGTFDNVSADRIAEVAFAAFQAVGRGAQPEIVEGIGLYGYRKQIPGDRIAVWANGFNDTAKGGVPAEVGADLVANAMEHDWDDATFNTFKWSLVDAQKRKFDIRRYAAFLFQRMEAGQERPGAITLTAVNTFRRAQQRGEEVPIANYHGVFSIPKEPPAPPPPPPPAEAAEPAQPAQPAQQEGQLEHDQKGEPAQPSAEQAAAAQAESKADDAAKEQEATAAKAQEDARVEREQAETAAAAAAAERKAAEAQEREAKAQQAAAEKAKAQAEADAEQKAQEQAALEAANARKAAREAKKKAAADGRAAEKLRKKAEADRKAADKATKKAAKARAAADKAKKAREALAGSPAAAGPNGAAADTSGADAESGEAAADHPAGSPPKFSDAKMAAVWPDLNAAAHTYLGVPYVWGGETKKGIDCSGFTKNSYREGAKVGIPRNSRMQWKTGQRVDYDKLQAGDLVFFDTMGHGVSHVGMVIDPATNTFMHASSSRGVMEADLSKQWFRKRYLGARRVIQ